jgi:hypothetical protein
MAHARDALAALVLCMTLTGVSFAAEKIALTCSGTVSDPSGMVREAVPQSSVVIDLDQGTLSGIVGYFNCTVKTNYPLQYIEEKEATRCVSDVSTVED